MTHSGLERDLTIRKPKLQTEYGSELNIVRIRVREAAEKVTQLTITEERLGEQTYSPQGEGRELKVTTRAGQSNFPPPHWEATVTFLLDALDDEAEKERILVDLGIRRSDISALIDRKEA